MRTRPVKTTTPRMAQSWVLLVLASLVPSRAPADDASPGTARPEPALAAAASPFCTGEYADELALSPAAREFELSQPQYTFCIRTSAVYECPFYAADGTLKRRRRRVQAHGTGFGLRRDGTDTLVVTNEHVAEWPPATDAEHPVEDVPPGCRRVSDSLRIVESEADTYERDDTQLARVVLDPQLDVAVLRAKAALPVVPWRMGRSAALRERNAVDVRGFPLGVLRTTNVGKVTSAYQHDRDREWDHDDFVVDALLSPGSSGSPVFAVSCRTRELELVGIYHAGYSAGAALNAVVGIDQARDLLDTLKRKPRRRAEPSASDAMARERIVSAMRGATDPFFPFGGVTAAVRVRSDGALVFAIMPRQFPVRTQPVLVLEDLPAPGPSDFGQPGRVWVGDGRRIRLVDRSELDADAQAHLARALEALRRDAELVARLRSTERSGAATREQFEEVARIDAAVSRLASVRSEVAQASLDLAERLGGSGDAVGALSDALGSPPRVGPAAAQDLASAGSPSSTSGSSPNEPSSTPPAVTSDKSEPRR